MVVGVLVVIIITTIRFIIYEYNFTDIYNYDYNLNDIYIYNLMTVTVTTIATATTNSNNDSQRMTATMIATLIIDHGRRIVIQASVAFGLNDSLTACV